MYVYTAFQSEAITKSIPMYLAPSQCVPVCVDMEGEELVCYAHTLECLHSPLPDFEYSIAGDIIISPVLQG
jgi:hypothetical protein